MSLHPRALAALLLGVAAALVLAVAAAATVMTAEIGIDPYTNSTSQHATAVEPDSFSYGSTIVAAYQVGRFFDGGASNIGFSRSANGGSSWSSGALPGTTTFSNPPGPYARLSDPSVAYDRVHGTWLIASLAIDANVSGVGVVVNRSTDGGDTWGNAVTVSAATGHSDFDKDWIACDNGASSQFAGNCYVEYDDFGNAGHLHLVRSTDGGQTWTELAAPNTGVLGGQPVVQPNGTVVMPIDSGNETGVISFVSTDGGTTWGGPYKVSKITSHLVDGGLRTDPLPSAEVDSAGKVYVVWQDCRFRRHCSANDLVLSTSTDGRDWSAVTRVPIDATSSTADHFVPGLGVDAGASGKLGLAYYFYPAAACGSSCQLEVGYISSSDGGAHWSAPTTLAGPMTLRSIASTSDGRMVGDYMSTSFSGGSAYPVFAVGAGSSDCATATCDEGMYTTKSGLAAPGGTVGSADVAIPNAASDHPAPQAAVRRR